ncbi:SpoIID/LytB domain-containing protein, partial [bacterium]|nr:SpoIID/LytB domain-containing protein [bacterium]
MKNWVRAGILLCLFLSVETICFADNPYLKFHIPKKTLEIANDTPNVKPTAVEPTSPVVRVGIGTEGFKSYTRTSVSIYGTSEIILCDNDTAVKTFPAGVNLNIKLNSQGSFDITTDSGEKISSINGVVRFVCPQGLLGVRWLKRAGVNALYHGALEIVKANETSFNLVNIIEVEQYLRGVVPNEMPVSFGLEALKAQSVAARNYVLSPRTKASPNYDVVDSVASQVYYGAGTEKKLSDTAVKETEGI